MHVFIIPQIRRVAIRCLLTFAATMAPNVAGADDFDCGSKILPSAVASTSCDFELDGTEELCGWGEDCPLATHDSGLLPTPAAAAILPPSPVASRPVASKSSLDTSVTAIATAALASAGVSVEQIVEPFAMVGPYLDNSLEMVKGFQGWWETALTQAESLKNASAALQDELDMIAAEEPVDVENFGPSVIMDMPPTIEAVAEPDSLEITAVDVLIGSSPIIATIEAVAEPYSLEITAIDVLIGSSPIIATIEDDYLPYDLSARDLTLWSVFPTATHPFCVRSHLSTLNESPMWDEFDQAVHADDSVAPILETASVTDSADCLLYDFIWQVETWSAKDSPLWSVLSPRSIGGRFASIAADGNRFVQGARSCSRRIGPRRDQRMSQALRERLCWQEPVRSMRANLSHRSPRPKFGLLNSQAERRCDSRQTSPTSLLIIENSGWDSIILPPLRGCPIE